MILGFGVGFWVGGSDSESPDPKAGAPGGELSEALSAAQRRLDNQRQQVINSGIAAQVDRESLEHVRQTMVRQQQELARVQKELDLYRSLLKDDQSADGLYIDQLRIYANQQGAHGYRLVVHQKAQLLTDIKVDLEVRVVGDTGGQPLSYTLGELDPVLGPGPLAVVFKYFHIIEGTMQLPPDFKPQQVIVVLRKAGAHQNSTEATFNWSVENN